MLAGGLANGIVYFDLEGGGDVDNDFSDDTAAVSDLACSVLLSRRAVDTGTENYGSSQRVGRRNHRFG